MCTFHVKQNLNRRIQKMGLSELYRSTEPDGMLFNRLIRRIGALQLVPIPYLYRATGLINKTIQNSLLQLPIQEALKDILQYYVWNRIKNLILKN